MCVFQPEFLPARSYAWRRPIALATSLAALLLGQPLALGQTTGVSPTFAVKGFEVTGDNPLSDADVDLVLAPYLRADATIDTLQKATVALENALKQRGFNLHKVVLPPQEVGATVRLNLLKFSIGKVIVEGAESYSEANIRASVPELREGAAPNFRTLAVQTAIANESQSKQLQVALRESKRPDTIDARIIVRESAVWSAAASLTNTGSAATGQDRLTFSASHNNVLDRDHQITAAYTTSVERPGDVQQLGLNYRVPFYALGGVLGASYSHSTVTGEVGGLTIRGAGQTAGANYTYYLYPMGGYRSFISAGLEDKRFDPAVVNGVAVQGVRRSRPLTLGYSARAEKEEAVWSYNFDWATNLAGGAGNNLTAYRTEDPRINAASWNVLRGNAAYATAWAGGWQLGVRGQFQLSGGPLISGEQFGLGGASSVRGTSERPMSGDRGWSMTTEITTRELTRGLRLLGFVDVGYLSNANVQGTARPASDRLASLGLGLRYQMPGIVISADYGRIVVGSGQSLATNPNRPESGDQKLHVNVSARF